MQNGETNLEAGDRLAEVGYSHHLHWDKPAQQSFVRLLCTIAFSLMHHSCCQHRPVHQSMSMPLRCRKPALH